MKQLFALLTFILLLTACQMQEPRMVPPQQSYQQQNNLPPVPAVLQEQILAQPAVVPQIAPKPDIPELGAVDLSIHAYGAQETGGSARLNTPLEYRINIAQSRASSPPLTSAYSPTIFLAVIKSDGQVELYGTPDVPGILPSNYFVYDAKKERWVNDKGLSQSEVGMQRYVGIVHWNGKTKQLEETVNVR